jgi:hypothetical protein
MSQAITINQGLKPFDGAAAIISAADIQLLRGAFQALFVSAFGSGFPLLPSP